MEQIKILLICGVLLSLIGCASTNPTVDVQEVKIPVGVCPVPKDFVRPALPIDTLTAADINDSGKVVLSYKATVRALEGYIQQLETELNGYKPQ